MALSAMSELPDCPIHLGLQPLCLTLENGLAVRLFSQPWASRVGLCVRVNAGSHDEPLAYPGLAHFLEHLLFLGSTGFAAEQRLMPFVQACGGQVNATTQAHYTEYFCEVPADYLEEALVRLLDMLVRPLLEEAEQLRERDVVHAEFIARSQDVDTLLGAALGQALAAGHRCAVFQAGNRDTLPVTDAAFQQALKAFHQAFYHAGNCQLSIVAPLPLAHLTALSQRYGALLPEVQAVVRSRPAPLLPLRTERLRLNLPDAAASLHLGFALELPETHADSALDWLLGWLLDETPAGLNAGLREHGLGEVASVRVLYCHAGQALLLLSMRGVAGPDEAVALLLDWLAFVSAQADPLAWHKAYQQTRQLRLCSMTPLALALDWQAPVPDEGGVICQLLQQLQEPQRRCVLQTDERELPLWSGAGFPLKMRAELALPLPVLRGRWQLPARNPLLAVAELPTARLAVPAAWRWLATPVEYAVPAAAMAVWQARCCFAEPLGANVLLNLAHTALRAVTQHLHHVGISLSLEAEAASLSVRVQGSARLIPAAVGLLMPALLQPTPAQWSALEVAEAPSMPIRQLLAASAELIQEQAQVFAGEVTATLQQRYRRVRIEALGVGLDRPDQLRIEHLFSTSVPWPSVPVALLQSGLHWRMRAAPGDSALLLFCPQVNASPATEACWRMLAHLHQGAFYQRLRSELQLGYAVFCSYRQIQGRRGLLFGVQSPGCKAAEILQHIQAFLQARSAWLAGLDQAALAASITALRGQWQVQARSCDGLAERAWLAHLAGLSDDHGEAVQQALQSLSLVTVQQAQQALLEASAGWYVLSNEPTPAHI